MDKNIFALFYFLLFNVNINNMNVYYLLIIYFLHLDIILLFFIIIKIIIIILLYILLLFYLNYVSKTYKMFQKPEKIAISLSIPCKKCHFPKLFNFYLRVKKDNLYVFFTH